MRFRNERGATMITVAITLTLLMGAAAVAIDLAAGWNERRQDQTAADLAAMAGALSFPGVGLTQADTDAMIEAAMRTARVNLETTYTNAEWAALWQNCVDTYPGFVGLTHSSLGYIDCIGMNTAYFRVRVPDQDVETSFARILGFNVISTHAGAVVELLDFQGAGGYPFVLPGNAAGQVCLDTQPSGTSPAGTICGDPSEGSFGTLAVSQFGLPPITSPACNNNSKNWIPNAIAMGMDHVLDVFSQSQWNAAVAAYGWDVALVPAQQDVDAVTNMDECIYEGGDLATPGDGVPIEGVWIDTGNSHNEVTEGILTGTNFPDGGDARLTRHHGNYRVVEGYQLDNTSLWSHLIGATSIPECQPAAYPADGSLTTQEKNDLIESCLLQYAALPNPQQVQIFANTIVDNNPRLGLAPRLWHHAIDDGTSLPGTTPRPIKSHDLVYLGGILFDDNNDTWFFPDEEFTTDINLLGWSSNSGDIEEVTGFVLLDNMVSQYVLDEVGKVTPRILDPTLYE